MTSLVEVYRRFPTREAAVAHLVAVRWPEGTLCPNCGAATVAAKVEANQADRLQCWCCQRSFSATVGTIFHHSHVDLQRWYLLIALMLAAKKGLSASQAARDLDMRRPTVWSMMHRIRRAMADDRKLLAGIVEMDEAYVGGKPRRKNRRDDDEPGPWDFYTATDSHFHVSAPSSALGYGTICTITNRREDTPDAGSEKANARLIAAAPELLAAFKETLEYIVGYAESADSDDPVHEMLKRWQALVAKAEGR